MYQDEDRETSCRLEEEKKNSYRVSVGYYEKPDVWRSLNFFEVDPRTGVAKSESGRQIEYDSDIIITDRIREGDIVMALTTITARVDQKDKADFDAFCSNVGLNTSTAINLFVKAVLREKRIPFEIAQSPDPFYSEANMAYVKKSVQELREGKGTAHELIEVEDE